MARGRITRRVFAQQAAAAAASLVWGGSVASRAANASSADELDEALRLLSRYGPEFGGGLANHGPMACEALVALGRKESVLPWVQGYRRRLQDRPPQRERLDESSVLAALGKHERVADLTAFFRRELAEAPWREVLARWVPVLAPGLSAVAFHGVIRTGHAVRSLDRAEGKKRVAELADGLGYWAANFHALPGAPPSPAPAPARTASAEEALGALVRIPPERRRRGNLVAALGAVDDEPAMPAAFARFDPGRDPAAALSELTELFARVYLANAGAGFGSVIAFIHAVTGPSAVRLLLPHLPAEVGRAAVWHAWQACASFYVAVATVSPAAPRSAPSSAPAEIVDRAIATRDEHAIKFTEACLRENALRPRPAYLVAAQNAVGKLGDD